MPLPAEIARLSVGHLQLEGSAAGVADRYDTIGALVSASASGELRAGSPGVLHIRRILSLAAAATHNEGAAGWDHFRRTRPAFVTPERIFFYSPRLDRLQSSSRDGSLGKLHLSRRGMNAAHAGGAATIGALIAWAKRGILELRAVGHLTAMEITSALAALSDSLTAEGAVNWIGYAERRQFKILPTSPAEMYSGRDFLWGFPQLCEAAVVSKLGAASTVVLQRRIFRHPDISVSLREVGNQLGITGERVRLLERSILEMLDRAIWHEEYAGCRFRFRREFFQPLYDLADRVQSLPDGTLTPAAWRNLLQDCWGVGPPDLGLQSTVILQLLGVNMLAEELPIPPTTKASADAIRQAAAELKQFVTARGAGWFSLRQLSEHLSKKMGPAAPDEDTITAILESLPMLEQDTANRAYRVRLAALKNHVDRAERILREHGMPMHFRDIHSEIMRLAPTALAGLSPRDLSSRLASTPRFVPVGRTGVWSLREWPHIQTGTVADIAARLLRTSECPLSESNLFELISPLRQVRRGSIGTLLREDQRFRRVAPATWALVSPKPDR